MLLNNTITYCVLGTCSTCENSFDSDLMQLTFALLTPLYIHSVTAVCARLLLSATVTWTFDK